LGILLSVSRSTHQAQNILFGLVLPVLLLAAGIASFVAMGSQQPKLTPSDGGDSISKMAKLSIVGVQAIRSYEGLESLDVSISGTVVPFRQVTLGAEIAGRIQFKSEECRIGRYVHKGDVLFKIDPTDFQLDVDRLAAMRDSEYAQQKELDQELANAKRSLTLSEEDYALQEREQKRLESLPSGFASATEVDQARRLRITSANQRLTIQNQLQMIEARRTRIQLAERLAATQLEQAKVNLDRTIVKAPLSGVIVTESVQEDSYVQKGATLCMIEDTERVEVSCNLRSDQLLLVLDQSGTSKQSGASKTSPPSSRIVQSSSYELPKTPVTISYLVAGRDNTEFQWHGHLSRYEGIGIDQQTRTIPVRVSVDNPREVWQNGKQIQEDNNGGLPALVRGMFVECKIQTKPNQSLVLLPKLALKPGNQVWWFEPDDSLVRADAPEPDVNAVSNFARKPDAPKVDLVATKPKLDLDKWAAGRVRVLSDVRVISTIRLPSDPKQEYWIAESRADLPAGSLTVVTPLANIIGDGSDKARCERLSHGGDQKP